MTNPYLVSTVKFRDYDARERQELARKGWALPDGSFPIANKEDLADALHRIGTTKHPRSEVVAFIRKRARALGATDMLGDKTASQFSVPKLQSGVPARSSAKAQFSTARHYAEDGTVIRRGKVFEAGSRLDMHGIPFVVSQAELAKIVLDFQPFPVGSGHPEAPSPLDGHLGTVKNLYLGSNHSDLWAEAHIPEFVDSILGDNVAKVSMTFDRATKTPLSLDFVDDPNVVDAALVTSFARTQHDTALGQSALQQIHDAATLGGAVCQSANASRHEAKGIQQVHDIACQHGAKCDNGKSVRGMGIGVSTFSPAFSSGHGSVGLTNGRNGRKEKSMNWKTFWTGLFDAAEKQEGEQGTSAFSNEINDEDENENEDIDTGTGTNTEIGTGAGASFAANNNQERGLTGMANTSVLAPEKAALAAAQARNYQLESELARERAHRIESEAASFADGEITEHRSLPAEREVLIELYRQASADDGMLGTVKLANGLMTSRVERLKALFGTRSEHWMTKEMLSNTISPEVISMAMKTAEAGITQQVMDASRKEKLLNMTPLGQATVKAGTAKK